MSMSTFSQFLSKMASTNNVSSKLIGTHNGKFHCDEALACFMLRKLPEYSTANIIRSRDPVVLAKCDIVVDVGGVYDPSTFRYDHHQRSFNDSMNSLTDGKKPWTTKLSSAGLVYLHYGQRVLDIILGTSDPSRDDNLFDYMYTNFIEEVDGVDNGIECIQGTRKYAVTSTISQRVGRLNPSWNSPDQDSDSMFYKAMDLVGREFVERVHYYRDVWMPARDIVKKAIEERLKVDPFGEIIHLSTPCPWQNHLFELEKEYGLENCIKYVLYQDTESGKWRVQAVATESGSFTSRLPLYEPWRGVRDDELSQVTGIPGCVFVHASGFIGGSTTYDGVLEMARKSIKLQKK